MKLTHQVKVISYEEVHELPDSWINEDFREILSQTDFEDLDGMDSSEFREYAIMALQELEPDEAAALILNYRLGNRLSNGQIQNLSHEMMDEKLWEEYTDINLHKDLFDCSVLMKWALPGNFPETDAVKCVIQVESGNHKPLSNFDKTFLTRLLAMGMNDHAVLNRLFYDQVHGAPFPEAEGIIWQFETTQIQDKTLITIYSSSYWLHPMDAVDHYSTEVILSHEIHKQDGSSA